MTQNDVETVTTALPPLPPPQDIHARKTNGKKFSDLPLAEQFIIARRVLDNTTGNPQIANVMIRFGYDQAAMADYRVLFNEAVAANSQQVKEYGERSEAYADFNKFFAVAKHEYSTLRKLLRVALKTDRQKLDQLGVNEAKMNTISGILKQMQVCYDNIFTDRVIAEKLARIGTTEEMIRGYIRNYDATQSAYTAFYKEDSEAVNATRLRDEKVEALCDFLYDFFILARIAFADQPDLLKQIT